MISGLIMRLHHLGLRVAMQGDMAAPPLAQGDLFLCSAGPGELATVTALMQVARDAVQLHGAIGVTDEYDLGLYLQRALVLAAWLGNGNQQRRRYANLTQNATAQEHA